MTDEPDASAEQLAKSYGERLSQPWSEPADAASSSDLPSDASGQAPPPLASIVEALLFVGGPPLTAERAGEAARGLTPALFTQLVEGLNRDYRRQGRPYRIQPRDQGYELALRPRFRGVMERLYGAGREARLSPAALDVLALVAYRQPIGKNEIDSLRGAESGAALRQLVRLGLAAVQRAVGTWSADHAPTGEAAYRTTPRFLNVFGLRNLDDLPRTQDLHKL
ncbi:MAG TPA: SMC-Scp complex subunit ScpB [Gemmataceae bacterium]|nr:SMC-Scp complex subunit ScpB [Gemmataceae bacterium]